MRREKVQACITAVTRKVQVMMKKRCGKGAGRELCLHVLLVLLGVRTSYLVDCMRCDLDELVSLLEVMLLELGDDAGSSLVVVEVPTGDFFILSAKYFRQRMLLREDKIFGNEILLNISGGSLPSVVTGEALREVEKHLRRETECILHFCIQAYSEDRSSFMVEAVSIALDTSIAGYECLAGWLLGYLCVYNCPARRGDSPSRYQNSLSMIPLLKISIEVDVCVTNLIERVTVKEYTIPQFVFDIKDKSRMSDASMTRGEFDELLRDDAGMIERTCEDLPDLLERAVSAYTEVTMSTLAF